MDIDKNLSNVVAFEHPSFKDNSTYFTYARWSHFKFFSDLSEYLYNEHINPSTDVLKRYQDLLILYFIKREIPKGAKILEIGGGQSRILQRLSDDFECWNVDKLEGLGNGPRKVQLRNVKHINDYIGCHNEEVPSDYFDLVFSISALEHVPRDSSNDFYNSIISDIDRILKPNAWSVHALDVVFLNKKLRNVNPFVYYLFDKVRTLNRYLAPEVAIQENDFYLMSEYAYRQRWEKITKQPVESFGLPTSINAFWKK